MNLQLVIIGKKQDNNKIILNSENMRIVLRESGKFIADISKEILPTFTIDMKSNNTRCDFELFTGEKFQNIKVVWESEE